MDLTQDAVGMTSPSNGHMIVRSNKASAIEPPACRVKAPIIKSPDAAPYYKMENNCVQAFNVKLTKIFNFASKT